MNKKMFAVRVEITEVAIRYIEAESREDLNKYLEGEEANAEEVDFDSRSDHEEILEIYEVKKEE